MKFYYAIKAAYPDIKIISNCDGSSRPLDHPADFYDFHVRTVLSAVGRIFSSFFIFVDHEYAELSSFQLLKMTFPA